MNRLLIPLTHLTTKLQQNPSLVCLTFLVMLGGTVIADPSLASSEKSLEELFEEITVEGTIDPLDYLTETFIDIPTEGTLDLSFSLLLEEAGFSERNIFGIYDTVSQNHFEIFSGEAGVGSQFDASITSDSQLVIGDMTYDLEGPLSFYLGRQNRRDFQKFYSNDSKGKISQALVYQGSGQQLSFNGVDTSFTDSSYMIGFEDIHVSRSDRDYNDAVVLAQAVLRLPEPDPAPGEPFPPANTVPEPSLLSGLAMIAMLTVARKRTTEN
ncbi:MAG: PEP-CTERM sorting domain-containing protein [Crocosphaera sp.]